MLPPDLALDRPPARTQGWVALDVLAAALLAFAAQQTMTSVEYIDAFAPVVGIDWLWVFAPISLIAVRRFVPATALLLCTGFLLAGSHAVAEGNANLAGPIIIYTVATSRPPNVSRWIVMAAAIPASLAALLGPDGSIPLGVVALLTIYAIAWIVGVRARDSQDRAERLEAEAAAARAEAQAQADRAVDEERARIARELHDAVGHAVNVMVLQAGAARMGTADAGTADALRSIEQVGRAALTDLDRMLGLLKADEEGAPLAPQRGLDDLGDLVEGLRATGREVALDVCADDVDPHLDAPASAAAYRIVQEALTNVAKHAGPASVVVTVRADPDALDLSVVDDGRGAAAAPAEGGGRGLLGMRERAHVLGGTLEAGPCPGGGYAVTARLPRERVR